MHLLTHGSENETCLFEFPYATWLAFWRKVWNSKCLRHESARFEKACAYLLTTTRYSLQSWTAGAWKLDRASLGVKYFPLSVRGNLASPNLTNAIKAAIFSSIKMKTNWNPILVVCNIYVICLLFCGLFAEVSAIYR